MRLYSARPQHACESRQLVCVCVCVAIHLQHLCSLLFFLPPPRDHHRFKIRKVGLLNPIGLDERPRIQRLGESSIPSIFPFFNRRINKSAYSILIKHRDRRYFSRDFIIRAIHKTPGESVTLERANKCIWYVCGETNPGL